MTQLASSQTLQLNAPSSNTSTAVKNGLRLYAHVRNKTVFKTVHIPTKNNLADIFTKILPSGDFIRLRDQLLHPTHIN